MSEYDEVIYAAGYIMDVDGNKITEGPIYEKYKHSVRSLRRSMQKTAGHNKADRIATEAVKPMAIKSLVAAIAYHSRYTR